MASKRPTQSESIDSDFDWLKTHLNYVGELRTRVNLAKKVRDMLARRLQHGALPYTLGVFGGWGTGKTTFLALLAREMEAEEHCKLVYFNSWKYAGFMEIVPALIYKILQYGTDGTRRQRDDSATRVLLALGKKYSDQIGDWAKTKIGVNPAELFQDVFDIAKRAKKGAAPVSADVIRAYYTQVDKAQDELQAALGTVTAGVRPENAVVVFIDELDRCDPDEAFTVMKQMRVLFGMRNLPIIFVVCANPEPIGLAIKHRYGLESETGDYEARRILEKFVDSYQDLEAVTSLRPVVEALWEPIGLPWLIGIDEANVKPRFDDDVILNATAIDTITTGVALFANLRVLRKSFEYVSANTQTNREFLWAKWLLEIANQMDPRFRRDIRVLAETVQKCVGLCYESLQAIEWEVELLDGRLGIRYKTDKGNTLFAIVRSFFWEHAKREAARLQNSSDSVEVGRGRALQALLSNSRKVDFVVLLGMLPFKSLSDFKELSASKQTRVTFPFDEELRNLGDQLGFELSE